MRILVSQFRCPKCKKPIKHALVEECPRCGVRLANDYVSKNMGKTIVGVVFGFIFAALFFLIVQGDDLDTIGVIFSLGLTIIVVVVIMVYLYFKNKKKLHRDREYEGTTEMVDLEEVPVYADIEFDKRLLIAPIISLLLIFLMIGLLMVDLSYYDFISFDSWPLVIFPAFILLAVFGISAFYAFSKFNKQVKRIFEEG